MNEVLIQNWNDVVKPTDTVFVLGDFAMTRNAERIKSWVERLNGTKHLILGNHDELKVWRYLDCGFASVHTSLQIEEFILAHDPAVYNALPEGSLMLCGHVHTLFKSTKDKKVINVGVDVWDYRPVSINTIREYMIDDS